MSFYSIPPTLNFARNLASFCDEQSNQLGIPVSQFKIYLPTRRAIRVVQEAFLNQNDGGARLLPIIESIGDADLMEANFSTSFNSDILPVISPLRRKIILARLLEKSWPHNYNYVQALAIADDLGRLIDQIHTENLDISNLSSLIEIQELAQYWEITSSFLITLLGSVWPNYLKEKGQIDPGLGRQQRIKTLSSYYRDTAPVAPVIIAGSTGSIPATRELIKVISQQRQGHIILPALDTQMDDASWHEVSAGHPQYLLKILLKYCDVKRDAIKTIGHSDTNDRLYLASEMMRPAITTDQWSNCDHQKIENGLNGITIAEAQNDQEEATTIALIMAEAIQKEKQETAILITPDRHLAKRVQKTLKRWGIDIDDSAGTPLQDTPIGQYSLSLIQSLSHNALSPIPFLNALKNKYCGDGGESLGSSFRSHVRIMEKKIFRGVSKNITLEKLADEQSDSLNKFYGYLKDCFAPLCETQKGKHSLRTHINSHICTMEKLAATESVNGADRLWVGDDGKSMATFFTDLLQQNDSVPDLTLNDYIELITGIMNDYPVSYRYGKHPKLAILGQIESRISHADRLILAGLNENTWPADQGFDTWMSANMRVSFGLPSADQKTTLSAHDFLSGFCAPHVFITRSNKTNGQPTLPSRWIQRLEAVMSASNISKENWPHIRGKKYLSWAEQAITERDPTPISRPIPQPGAALRPKEFSATEIEKWIRDPYWIYAKKILHLKKMDMVDMDISPREKGNIIHDVLDQFVKTYPDKKLPDDAYEKLINIGQSVFKSQIQQPEIYGLWWPRFLKSARWFINHENEWRQKTQHIYTEIKGRACLPIDSVDYVLSAKADRIETRDNNHLAIIDYKTGSAPQPGMVNRGIASQLVLESFIASQNGFDEVNIDDSDMTHDLHYWSISGSGEGGKTSIAQGTAKKTAKDTNILIEEAYIGLTNLLRTFAQPETPYIASPNPNLKIKSDHNDYEHLERIAEWSVTGENDD